MVDPYWHLARPGPSGSLDIEPALRAIAEGEGLQYEELAAEVRRTLKQWRRRQLRHMRNER
jgi:hypothetical protein